MYPCVIDYNVQIKPLESRVFKTIDSVVCYKRKQFDQQCSVRLNITGKTVAHCWTLMEWEWWSNSKHWFTTSFLQPLPYFSYAIGPRKLSANEQFFVGTQTVVSSVTTTQIKQGVSFIAANKIYTSTNKTTIVWIETELFFFFFFFFFFFLFTRGGCVSCLRACFGARLLLQSY